MPIKRYNTFEDAQKDLWNIETDDKYYLKLKALFRFWGLLRTKKIKKGIQKFVNIDKEF